MTALAVRLATLLHDRWPELVLRFAQHLNLIGLALLFAIFIGVGLGLALAARPRLAQLALGAANMVQTIPSLALLALLLPILGTGARPAICALTLYAVMPILRNILAVLGDETSGLPAIGTALGLTPGEIVRHIKIPQGLPLLVSGLRTATVWSVGTATLCAFIGAGIMAMVFANATTATELMVSGFVMIFFVQVAGNSMQIFASEVFPTNARASGFGWASGIGRLATAFIMPMILWIQNGWGLMTVFGCLATFLLIAAVSVTQLGPESRQKGLDEVAAPTG